MNATDTHAGHQDGPAPGSSRVGSGPCDGKDILVLCHRVPYPPNKGDKIRTWHILRHLARRGWRIHLGTLADDPGDLAHGDVLGRLCASLAVESLPPWRKLCSPLGALAGTSLSVAYFRNARLQRFVDAALAGAGMDAALVVSAPMAEYLRRTAGSLPRRRVLDLVDVDSEKWRAYAAGASWPASWLFGLEGRLLGRYERVAGDCFNDVVLASQAEADVFRGLYHGPSAVHGITNGVDHEYFHDGAYDVVSVPGAMAFCGAMDYRANIDAVAWFAGEVLPRVRRAIPSAEFWVIGSKPAPAVLALSALPGVRVTGAVADVRPHVAAAALSVAPMRVARGVQNKVLEAMAMGKAVLATPQAFEGIEAEPGLDLAVTPGDPEAFAASAVALLADSAAAQAMGARARRHVEQCYSWEARLSSLDGLLG